MVAVYTGTDQDFATIAFGMPNMETIQYLSNQFNQVDRSMYRDPSFIDRAYSIFNEYNGSEALSKARALLNVTDSLTDINAVKYLHDIVDIQLAGPVMQRYIMANPLVREWYHDGRIDGYSNTYVDIYPSDIGNSHLDYRRVMDGIVEDKENTQYSVTYYFDNNNELPLMFEDKVDILNTWEALENYLRYGDEDPTDIYGGKL